MGLFKMEKEKKEKKRRPEVFCACCRHRIHKIAKNHKAVTQYNFKVGTWIHYPLEFGGLEYFYSVVPSFSRSFSGKGGLRNDPYDSSHSHYLHRNCASWAYHHISLASYLLLTLTEVFYRTSV